MCNGARTLFFHPLLQLVHLANTDEHSPLFSFCFVKLFDRRKNFGFEPCCLLSTITFIAVEDLSETWTDHIRGTLDSLILFLSFSQLYMNLTLVWLEYPSLQLHFIFLPLYIDDILFPAEEPKVANLVNMIQVFGYIRLYIWEEKTY